jgi:hypothetical protein
LFNVLVLSGFSSPADTIVPLRPPRPPRNCELSPHVRLNRGRQLTITNLLIFIRFADEEEFSESFETVNLMFNDTTPYNISVHNYYNVMTDGVRDYGEGHIAVYPNPVNTELNILAEDVSRVEIYDLLGKMVLSDDCPDSRIDVSSLMQGMYVVKVFTRNGCFTEKFMKK